MNAGGGQRFVLSQLLRVTGKEARHLHLTAERLRAQSPDLAWVESLETQVENGEMLDAFVSRFGRLQDSLGDKLLPAVLRASLEATGAQLDNLLRAEKLGWIDSVEQWVALRTLRNRLVHEYMESAADLHQALLSALAGVAVLIEVQQRLAAYAGRFAKPEESP